MVERDVKHIPELDAIRGCAALGIVLFHTYPQLFFFGWSFVDCFFALSGYLITTIILQHRESPQFLRAFYYRRMLRILPVYYLTLMAVLVVNTISRKGYSTDGLLQHLVFIQNVQGYWRGVAPEFIRTFAPSWSVAVEEQFYLFWPALLLLLGSRAIPWLAAGLLLIAIILRGLDYPIDILLTRADGLAFGCLLAAILVNRDWMQSNLTKLRRVFGLTSLLSLVYVFVLAYIWWGDPKPPWITSTFFAFGLLYFSLIGLVICYSGHLLLRPLRSKFLRYLGLISYSMYLFHQPLFTYLPKTMEQFGISSPGLIKVSVWSAIFVLPSLSYYLIERPVLNLKRRMNYSQTISGTGQAGRENRAEVDQGSQVLIAPVLTPGYIEQVQRQ